MKNKKARIFLLLYIVFSIAYILPSVYFYNKYHSLTPLWNVICEHYFFIDTDNYEPIQAIIYFAIISGLTICYAAILKYFKDIFTKKDHVFAFILLVQIIFSVGIAVNSSDINCYLGTGRLFEKYHQNPYYTTVRAYKNYAIHNGSLHTLSDDTVFQEGYENVWAGTRISYGPVHLLIYSFITRLSNGDFNKAIFITKCLLIVANYIICKIIYKLFNNNAFYSLLYALNPFVLITTVVNMHNDTFFLLFLLLAVYSIVKENKVMKSLLFLSLSVNIKFVSILFAPCIAIHSCKDMKISDKLTYCFLYTISFIGMTLIPWMPFFRNASVFYCIFDQVGRFSNSIYELIRYTDICYPLMKISMIVFVIIYMIYCFKMLIDKNFSINKYMMRLFYLYLFYLLFATTNLQYWYFLWFIPFIYFANKKEVLLILSLQIVTCLSRAFFIGTYSGDSITLIELFSILGIFFFYEPIMAIVKLIRGNKNIKQKTPV